MTTNYLCPEKFVLFYKSNFKKEASALLLFLILTLIIRGAVFSNFSSSFIGGSEYDSGLYIWLIKGGWQNLFQNSWFNTNAFYPYSGTLAWSDNFILPALLCLPFLKLGMGAAAVWNLLILTATFLNGFLTWRLAFSLSGKTAASLIAGAAFLSLSFFSSHLGHPQLQFAFFLPLTLIFIFRFFYSFSALWPLLAGLSIFLCFLTTVYYSIFTALAASAVFLCLYAQKPWYFSLRSTRVFWLSFLAGCLPVIFFLFPYLEVKEAFGARGLYEPFYFSATGFSYFSSTSFNLLYNFSSVWTHPEAQLFPGLIVFVLSVFSFIKVTESKNLKLFRWSIPLLTLGTCLFSAGLPKENIIGGELAALCLWPLAGLSLFWLFKLGQLEKKLGCFFVTNRNLSALFFVCSLLFFTISCGPLGRGGEESAPGIFTIFYYIFPGFDSIRAIGRAGVYALFFLIMTIPFIPEYVFNKRTWLAVVLGLLIITENYVTDYPVEIPRPAIPALEELKPEMLANDALVILPFTKELRKDQTVKSWSDFARLGTRYMNSMSGSEAFLVNGYSGQRSEIMKVFPRKFSGFPDERSINTLGLIANLKYVIYTPSEDPGFNKEEFTARSERFSTDLKLVKIDIAGNWLFEYQGISSLNNPFYLLAPSSPAGHVSLELMALTTETGSKVELLLFANDPELKTPWTSVSLNPDGSWQQYLIELPEVRSSINPVKIRFKVPENARVYLRQRRWTEK